MTIHFDSEKSLEDMFMNNIEHFSELLCGGDFKAIRQPKLGSYGTGDILFYNSIDDDDYPPTRTFHLLELKNTKLSHAHLSQCARYKTFFDNYFESSPYCFDLTVHLIGLKTFPDSNNDLCFLAQSIDWLEVYEIDFHPSNGVILNNTSGWQLGQLTPEECTEFEIIYQGNGPN